MSPRVSASEAAVTRAGIVEAAVDEASTRGLEAVTIGQLAERLEMSKAGVVGPFGSKEKLQLATLDSAFTSFRKQVWDPAEWAKPGIKRLEAITESWLAHLTSGYFPGGCFLTQTAAEFDGRPGEVRKAIAKTSTFWEKVLANEAEIAIEDGDLPKNTDPRQIAFELDAIAQGTNQAIQLRNEPDAADRGRRAMRAVLGLPG